MFSPPAARAQDCLWPTWTQVADNPELARYEHAMAYDAARGNVVMFGGRPAPGQVRGDTAVWNGKSWSVRAVPGPEARALHSMAFDASRGRIVLAGGVDASGVPLRDTWEWDGAAWIRMGAQSPDICGPVMAWDPVQRLVLVVDKDGAVWGWNGAEWATLGAGGESASCSGSAFGAWGRAVAFDPVRGVLVSATIGRTDEWSPGLGWVRTSQGAHPYHGTAGHAMFYSPTKGGAMLYGGNDTGGFGTNHRGGVFVLRDDLWCTWGGAAAHTPGLSGRQDHASVELPGGGALTFGGRVFNGVLGATLSLAFEPPAPPSFFGFSSTPRQFGRAIPGSSVSIRQYAFDAWNLSGFVRDLGVQYRWRRNGVDLFDGVSPGGAIISGSGTNELVLQGLGVADFGMYRLAALHCSDVTESGGLLLCPANLTAIAIPGAAYGRPDDKIDSADFFYYLAAFAAGNLTVADITSTGATAPGQPGWLVPDGVLHNDDFFAFLSVFTSGC